MRGTRRDGMIQLLSTIAAHTTVICRQVGPGSRTTHTDQDALNHLVSTQFRHSILELRLGEHLIIAWHVHVSALCCGLIISDRPPIAEDEAREAHPLLQIVDENVAVAAGLFPVDLVVGAHDRGGARPDGCLERRVVVLPAGSCLCNRIHRRASVLLLVHGEVLHGNRDACPILHAANKGRSQQPAQSGVLTREVLGISPAEGGPMHVDGRSQDHVRTLGSELVTHSCGPIFHEFRVPGGGKGERRGPRCDSAQHLLVRGAEASTSILHLDAGHAQPRHPENRADVVAFFRLEACKANAHDHAVLLLFGHLRDNACRPVFVIDAHVRRKCHGMLFTETWR
mmetsp:Transcript_126636/g.300867  ORF Transcript_126636/g.300867 Transcript_126636/m.300867 type:complete len:340 (+) Transcript_126636:1175-2194(+)